MKLGHEIHYSRKEMVSPLVDASKRINNINSLKESREVLEPLIGNLTRYDSSARDRLAREFKVRTLKWDREHLPKGEFDNPYAVAGYYLNPILWQD